MREDAGGHVGERVDRSYASNLAHVFHPAGLSLDLYHYIAGIGARRPMGHQVADAEVRGKDFCLILAGLVLTPPPLHAAHTSMVQCTVKRDRVGL